VRGSRIKNIVEELGGEKIDIVRWNESSQILISNALKPAEVTEVSLSFELGRATVIVNDDQLSLAIGKRGQNVRLAARLTGWDIDILTPTEFQKGTKRLHDTLTAIEGVTQEMVDKIIAMGLIDVRDVEEVGIEPLMEELQMTEELANTVVERAGEEAKLVTVEQEQKKAADARAKAEAASAFASAGSRGLDGLAIAPTPTPPADAGTAPSEDVSAAPEDAGSRRPGAFDAADGAAPEVTVHKASGVSSGDELSPEEEAVQGIADDGNAVSAPKQDENEEIAALAEGRTAPPSGDSR
jgi:N utilization substance protein A